MSTPDFQQFLLARTATAERLGTAPNQTWLLADADQTGGTMNAVRTTLGAGVDGPPPHFHKNSPEMFFMLSGSLRVLLGDEVHTISDGDFLLVPPLTPHAWGTLADEAADVLIIKAPGDNRFDYFRLADRIRRGEATPEEIFRTQDRFDNHWVTSDAWQRELAGRGGAYERIVPLDAPAAPNRSQLDATA